MRIVIFSNELAEAASICTALQSLGHACERHGSAAGLLAHLGHHGADLLLVDWQAAQAEAGLQAVISSAAGKMPLLAIAGRGREDDMLAALDAGADDVILRPLRLAELLTRVQARLKHAYPELRAVQRLAFGAYVFETPACRVTRDGQALALTQKEFELALLFFRHLDRPLSRAYIEDAIWPGQEQTGRSLDTHVSRVRNKLGLKPENGFRLAPVYSYGYRLQKLGD